MGEGINLDELDIALFPRKSVSVVLEEQSCGGGRGCGLLRTCVYLPLVGIDSGSGIRVIVHTLCCVVYVCLEDLKVKGGVEGGRLVPNHP